MKGNESVGALGALDPWVWLFRELLDPGLLGLALSLIGIVLLQLYESGHVPGMSMSITFDLFLTITGDGGWENQGPCE